MLLALTAAGVVATSIVESGVLTAERPDAVQPATSRPAPDDEPLAVAPDVVPSVDSEPLPTSGEPPVVAEGSAPAPPAPAPPEGSDSGSGEGSGVAVELAPSPAWEPLRRGSLAEPCLVRANRAVLATRMNGREPGDTDGPYTANGEPLYMFVDLANTTGVSQELTVVWRQQESGASFVDLLEAGPGSRWRTWAERPLPLDQIGPWVVQVVDAERCLIDEVSFRLAAPSW